ncbi:Transmembrane protein 138 [Liparis tanakae]|uniref:Transmembrane protein 138 n=1 Tax=Liparis tanakae TaxID=230148 RepID=A0A4Z2F4T6_9TELE|nr:Transmembrane protein 138 [Liparis tanakae]
MLERDPGQRLSGAAERRQRNEELPTLLCLTAGGPRASVLYYYLYKRTSEYLGDPRLYEDSPWLRELFARVRQ